MRNLNQLPRYGHKKLINCSGDAAHHDEFKCRKILWHPWTSETHKPAVQEALLYSIVGRTTNNTPSSSGVLNGVGFSLSFL